MELIISLVLQILNGTIDPGWVIAIMMAITGFLLVRILNRIEKRLEVHDKEIGEVKTDVAVIKSQIEER